jgi:hypothetical protein
MQSLDESRIRGYRNPNRTLRDYLQRLSPWERHGGRISGQDKAVHKGLQIPKWSPFIPEGKEIDWAEVDRALDWMTRYACCAGCENGGGPPDCTIRICARERSYELCSSCADLDSCTKFDWLKEHGSRMRTALKENRGRSKEEYIKAMAGKMP